MATPLRLVAEIEGAQYLWCTSHPDAGSASHGRTTIDALQYGGMTIVERSNPKMGTLEGESITLQIVAASQSNDEFSRSATLLTFLSASVTTTAATTFNVRSNALLTDNSYVHVGTECVQITDPTTTAVVVTRAQRGTTAQAHIRVDGEQASEVPVWSKVQAWEGRRVTLTAYEFDTYTVAMRGVITSAPSLNADGTMWLIEVSHIVTVLDQDVGVPSSVSTTIRGVKFGTTSAFGFRTNTVPDFSLVGFYETEQAMLTALGTSMDALAITGVDEVWPSVQNGVFTLFLGIGAGNIDQPQIAYGSRGFGVVASFPSFNPSNQTRYRLVGQAGASNEFVRVGAQLLANSVYATELSVSVPFPTSLIYTVPGTRSAVYPWANTAGDAVDETVDASIALAADMGVEAGSILSLSGGPLPEELRLTVAADLGNYVYSFDPVVDGLLGYCQRNGLESIVLDGNVRISVRKSLGKGTLYDFLSAIVTSAPFANDGTIPYVTSSDLDTSQTAILARVIEINSAALAARDYDTADSVPMVDLIAPELQLLGLMMTTSTLGKLKLVPFDVLTATTPYDLTITENEINTPHGEAGAWPTWASSADGIVSAVHMIAGKQVLLLANARVVRSFGRAQTVIDPADPAVMIYRDIASLSAHKNRGVGMLEIAPEVNAKYDLTVADATAIGSRIVRFFGQPYEVVTVRVLRSYTTVNARLGDIALLTSAHIPNSSDGTRGVTARRALVVGRSVSLDPEDPMSASVEFTLIMHGSTSSGDYGANNIAGYAPTAAITAATNVSGNIWDCTVTENAYAPTGSDDTDFFTVDDYVIAIQNDDATPNSRTGLVISKTATNIRVSFTGAAPWGGSFSGSYSLEFADVSYGMTDPQDDYCYTGDSTLLLSNGNPARIFA